MYAQQRRLVCGVDDTRIVLGKELHRREPGLNPDFKSALYNSKAGGVCPYGLTIAYGENVVMNGAQISLNTAVLGMTVEQGKIVCVKTNRGNIYLRLVINAAGVFAEDVARMARDCVYSIHPRRGTNSILDKKAGCLVKSISFINVLQKNTAHTKGGGACQSDQICQITADMFGIPTVRTQTYEVAGGGLCPDGFCGAGCVP